MYVYVKFTIFNFILLYFYSAHVLQMYFISLAYFPYTVFLHPVQMVLILFLLQYSIWQAFRPCEVFVDNYPALFYVVGRISSIFQNCMDRCSTSNSTYFQFLPNNSTDCNFCIAACIQTLVRFGNICIILFLLWWISRKFSSSLFQNSSGHPF